MPKISVFALLPLSLLLLLPCPFRLAAQSSADTQAPAHNLDGEALEIKGASMHLPPLAATIVPLESGFRTGLARHGLALRLVTMANDYQNLLEPPVARDEQAYIGQRATWSGMLNPMLIYDLRALGLKHAQLFAAGTLNKTNWQPNGPNAASLHSLYVYKEFARGRVEAMAGYLPNDWQFIGLMVGGSISSGMQGVYAVLPYENGLAHFQLTAPGLNVKVNLPRSTYVKTSQQRSLDPDGGSETIRRNLTGFRFMPKGDKLLTIAEVGLKREAAPGARSTWLRAGYLYNNSAFRNLKTGGRSSGNSTAYVLADQQLSQTGQRAENGLYAGLSLMSNPDRLNPYTRYVEARVFRKGTLRSRPGDMASMVATYTSFSPYLTDALKAQGKSYWRNATTVSASYNLQVRRGIYATAGITWNSAPAVTPRVQAALVPNIQLMTFF